VVQCDGADRQHAGTFYIENPATPGVAFLGFTRYGVPVIDNSLSLAVRPQYAPATGYFSYNYTGYGGEIINALKILGYNVNPAYNISIARGITSSYNSSQKYLKFSDQAISLSLSVG
jgi:hypothetical protein